MQDLLAGRGLDADPTAVLEGHGFDDLPAEDLSSALIHFAERSSIEVADVLAPLVTRLSPVPFAEGDIPPSDTVDAVLAEGGDVFDLLGELDLSGAQLDGADPSDFDLDDLTDLAEDAGVATDGASDEPAQRITDAFGQGHDADQPDETDTDPSELDEVFSSLDRVEVDPSELDEVLSILDDTDDAPVEDEMDDVGSLLDDLAEVLPTADSPDDDDIEFDLD